MTFVGLIIMAILIEGIIAYVKELFIEKIK